MRPHETPRQFLVTVVEIAIMLQNSNRKDNSDQAHSCLRGWRLSANFFPKFRTPQETPQGITVVSYWGG